MLTWNDNATVTTEEAGAALASAASLRVKSLDPAGIVKMQAAYRINEGIIRVMIVSLEKD